MDGQYAPAHGCRSGARRPDRDLLAGRAGRDRRRATARSSADDRRRAGRAERFVAGVQRLLEEADGSRSRAACPSSRSSRPRRSTGSVFVVRRRRAADRRDDAARPDGRARLLRPEALPRASIDEPTAATRRAARRRLAGRTKATLCVSRSPASLLAAGSLAGSVLYRRRSARRLERVDLYADDGSMVSLADGSPEAERAARRSRATFSPCRDDRDGARRRDPRRRATSRATSCSARGAGALLPRQVPLRDAARPARPARRGDRRSRAGARAGRRPARRARARRRPARRGRVARERPAVRDRPQARRRSYGTANRIEGVFEPGERVCLVEDVVTSGGAAIEAVEALREAGLRVSTAVCVVDREEGGADALARAAVRLRPLFLASELLASDGNPR